MGDLPVPSGLGRLTSQSSSTGRTIVGAVLSTTITKTGDYGQRVNPDSPGAGTGPTTSVYASGPVPPGPPGPLRPAGPDGGLTVT